jgi:hypothetical protein
LILIRNETRCWKGLLLLLLLLLLATLGRHNEAHASAPRRMQALQGGGL